MDNLAVTIAAGAVCALAPKRSKVYEIAGLFTLAHFIMFSFGFLGAERVAPTLGKIAPWLACIVLVYIGLGMMWQAWRNHSTDNMIMFFSLKKKILLALATSMDAFLVGTSFGFTYSVFWQIIVMLTGCVFITSVCGFKIGDVLGKKFGRWMEAAGGAVLVLLGIKLLLEVQGIL